MKRSEVKSKRWIEDRGAIGGGVGGLLRGRHLRVLCSAFNFSREVMGHRQHSTTIHSVCMPHRGEVGKVRAAPPA